MGQTLTLKPCQLTSSSSTVRDYEAPVASLAIRGMHEQDEANLGTKWFQVA